METTTWNWGRLATIGDEQAAVILTLASSGVKKRSDKNLPMAARTLGKMGREVKAVMRLLVLSRTVPLELAYVPASTLPIIPKRFLPTASKVRTSRRLTAPRCASVSPANSAIKESNISPTSPSPTISKIPAKASAPSSPNTAAPGPPASDAFHPIFFWILPPKNYRVWKRPQRSANCFADASSAARSTLRARFELCALVSADN